MTLQTWILIAAVFGAVVVLRLGRHRYTRRQRLLTLVVVAVLAGKYVRGMPTSGHDLVIEIACAALGALFGFAMLAVTSVTRDRRTGEIWIRAGLAYLALWTVMLGSRVVFAYTASDWERAAVARFFASHQLTGTAVTPAFVLMTIASLVIVMSGTALRARALGGSDAGPRDDAGQVPQPTAADARTLASGRPQT
jgi:hypothetical protein